jgi:hypothetical protein
MFDLTAHDTIRTQKKALQCLLMRFVIKGTHNSRTFRRCRLLSFNLKLNGELGRRGGCNVVLILF